MGTARAPVAAVTGLKPRIRRFRRADVKPMTEGFAEGSIAELTRYIFPYSRTAAFAEHERLTRQKKRHRFAITVDDKLVGICTLRPPLFSGMELTIGIFSERYQGKGIGTFTVRHVCAWGFEKLRLHRIELGVYPDNIRAQRCYLRCGFKKEALLRKLLYNDGEFRDVIWMSLLRKEWQNVISGRDGGRR